MATTRQPPRHCTAHNKTGNPCQKAPIKGGTVCYTHGGRAPKVAARAAVRAEVQAWGLDQPDVDAGETLSALVSMTANRLRLVSQLLQDQFEAYASGDPQSDGTISIPGGVRALIGHKYGLTRDGDAVPIEEATRGLAAYEAEWTDRLGRLCKLALDAGIAERQVQVVESQAALVATVLRAALADAGLGDRSDEVLKAVATRLAIVA